MQRGVLLALAACSMFGVQAAAEVKEKPKCGLFMPNYKTKSDTDCEHYWSCNNGELTEKKCPWLQKFDPGNAKCQLWPNTANCAAVPAPLPNEWPVFNCTGRPDFKTNSPWGCRYYIQCSGGKLSTNYCPWYFPKFQPSTQECWSIGRSVCVYVPTPPPDVTTTPAPTTSTTSPGTSSATETGGTGESTESPNSTPSESPGPSSEIPSTNSEGPTDSSESPTESSEGPTDSSEGPTASSGGPTASSEGPTPASEGSTASSEGPRSSASTTEATTIETTTESNTPPSTTEEVVESNDDGETVSEGSKVAWPIWS